MAQRDMANKQMQSIAKLFSNLAVQLRINYEYSA